MIIEYSSDAFATKQRPIVGRRVANLEFLKFFLGSTTFSHAISVGNEKEATDAGHIIKKLGLTSEIIHRGDMAAKARHGSVLQLDPDIGSQAWIRRHGDERDFSLIGLTHSLVDKEVIRRINSLITSPVFEWDALICTSIAAKNCISNILDARIMQLNRLGIKAKKPPLKMPVVPLGVDQSYFGSLRNENAKRQEHRRKLNINESDVVFLHYGRIDPFTKSHYIPLLLSIQQAAISISSQKRLVLMMAGTYTDSKLPQKITKAAKEIAPNIEVRVLDAGLERWATAPWQVADVFISLADNVQETFGLTPVEAMACGLPVIVSDWSGYKDTVVDNVCGFRIATTFPSPDDGLGVFFGELYSANIDPYPLYLARIAQLTSVDLRSLTSAIKLLVIDPDRRKRMGENGQKLVSTVFEWSVVLRQHAELSAELALIRKTQKTERLRQSRREPASALVPDATKIYSGFATRVLHDDTICSADSSSFPISLEFLYSNDHYTYLRGGLLDLSDTRDILQGVSTKGTSLRKIIEQKPNVHPNLVRATCLWLAKFGLLHFEVQQ